MAAVFDFPAEDIEASRKTATVVTLVFSIRDPSHTAIETTETAEAAEITEEDDDEDAEDEEDGDEDED